jgi:hypothetical protein
MLFTSFLFLAMFLLSRGYLQTLQRKHVLHTITFMSKSSSVRPTIDDIERISKGQAAKRRGTGSRAVPHRLNNLERKEWDLAKKRRFLQLRGSGWRRERGDSPLANVYRNYCDAVAIPCISVRRAIGNDAPLVDEVIIDFSPLRTLRTREMADSCIEEAKAFASVVGVDDFSDVVGKLGWEGIDDMLERDAIWRIPAYSVSVGFTVRSEGKRFAERMAVLLASAASGQLDSFQEEQEGQYNDDEKDYQ